MASVARAILKFETDVNTPRYGGQWTREKLSILRNYLDAYTTALKNQPFRLIYVDGFAGSGFWAPRSASGLDVPADFREMWKGSAALALDIHDKQFDRLVFIEHDQERCRSLQRLARQHAGRGIKIVNEDANQALPRFCSTLRDGDRGVVFLDPFATQVSWNTVSALANTNQVDCWILFPLGAIARMMPSRREPESELAEHLDRVFGGRQYWQATYQEPPQLGLFGVEPSERSGGSDAVIRSYRDRLSSVFRKVAPTERVLRNSKNAPMFALFFAASNERGAPIAIRIADHILKAW